MLLFVLPHTTLGHFAGLCIFLSCMPSYKNPGICFALLPISPQIFGNDVFSASFPLPVSWQRGPGAGERGLRLAVPSCCISPDRVLSFSGTPAEVEHAGAGAEGVLVGWTGASGMGPAGMGLTLPSWPQLIGPWLYPVRPRPLLSPTCINIHAS